MQTTLRPLSMPFVLHRVYVTIAISQQMNLIIFVNIYTLLFFSLKVIYFHGSEKERQKERR